MNYPIIQRLTESYEEATAEEVEEIIKWIKQNGSKWLNECKGLVAYRGIDTQPKSNFEVRPIRTDRRPLSSSPELHELLIQSMENSRKVATRSNSVFVTGYPQHATGYNGFGQKYPWVTLFTNDFHYTWSPDIDDAFLRYNPTVDPTVAAQLEDVEWLGDDKSLNRALKTTNEILVAASQVALVHHEVWWNQIAPLLNIQKSKNRLYTRAPP